MNKELSIISDIPAMTERQVHKVKLLESLMLKQMQVPIPVNHFIHGGMYVRSVMIPAGTIITGALIKIETSLVMNGHAMIHTGEKWIERSGYNVIPAAAHRKQIFVAISDINLTMFFPTAAKTVKHAEEQFTSEFGLLQNRRES